MTQLTVVGGVAVVTLGLMHVKNPNSPSGYAGVLHAPERPCSH